MRYLVAHTDGRDPTIIHADSAQEAVQTRADTDEEFRGNAAVWLLGSFPEQFETRADGMDVTLRPLGRANIGKTDLNPTTKETVG